MLFFLSVYHLSLDLNRLRLASTVFRIRFRSFCYFLHFGLLVQDVGHHSINTDASYFCSAGLPLSVSVPHFYLHLFLLLSLCEGVIMERVALEPK